jgi:ABC-type phosphonate transport system ATPase subunit
MDSTTEERRLLIRVNCPFCHQNPRQGRYREAEREEERQGERGKGINKEWFQS